MKTTQRSDGLPFRFRFTRVWIGGPTDGKNVLALQQWGKWVVKRGVWPFRWTTFDTFWATIEVADRFDTDDEAKQRLAKTARMIEHDNTDVTASDWY